jgi:ssDNA-binding replication factor A large subunit
MDDTEESPEVRLKDLRAGLPPVHVLGRVVSASRRDITGKKDGRRRSVLSGLLSDGTATVRFTWWDPPSEGVDRGTVLRAVNAQVREFRERPELSFGWSTRIQPASDLELPRIDTADFPLCHIADLDSHAEGFRLEVRIAEVRERTVSVGEERRVLHSGRFEDGTGAIPFTAWIDFRLKSGDTVGVSGGYVRVFRGRLEIALDERSHVEGIPARRVAPTPVSDVAPQRLGTLEAQRGAPDGLTEGLVVGLGSPSGIVLRCPSCVRTLQEGVCRIHGAVPGTPDLRVRLLLDDGTSVATVNVPRDLAEKLTGQGLPQWLERRQGNPDGSATERDLRDRLIGLRLKVRGMARVDDFGLAIFPTAIEPMVAHLEPLLERLARRLAEGPP